MKSSQFREELYDDVQQKCNIVKVPKLTIEPRLQKRNATGYFCNISQIYLFWWYSLVARMRKVNAFCIEGKQQIVSTFPCPGRDGGSIPPTTAEYFEI